MQFTYPELLWALFLLLIPIIIHLFQLRRFKKTPFTNVRLLKKVVAESRRSQKLKKWLLLLTRLLLIGALVIAFAQPFLAGPMAMQAVQNVIYLDDSFSMQARNDEGSLLETAVQDLLKVVPEEQEISLFTNDRVYEQVTIKELRNELLSLKPGPNQLPLESVYFKANTLFDRGQAGIKNLIVVSDFQKRMAVNPNDSVGDFQKHLVQLLPENRENASIDSAYISDRKPNSVELTALLSNSAAMDALPVSLYNADTLIAKTSVVWSDGPQAEVLFSLPANRPIQGRIEITDAQLTYDNQLFFTIEDREKINVLAIGPQGDQFLGRIFTEDEFKFTSVELDLLNYSQISSQNLIILNELPGIPAALNNAITAFVENGGNLVVIPGTSVELPSYNSLLANFAGTGLGTKSATSLAITSISFDHPLYENVFEKQVTNFQFPIVKEYYNLNTRASSILSFQGGGPFLSGSNGFYVFSSPLSLESSNFKISPLVVPTFYNMGVNSLQLPRLYYHIGVPSSIDIPVSLGRDRIMKVQRQSQEFIPRQQSYTNKTSLYFEESPLTDGQFNVVASTDILKRLSFNYQRQESELDYADVDAMDATSKNSNIAQLFDDLENEGRVTALWKWFVILALLCALAELLIQKFLK